MLTAVISANENGIYNDGQYGYDAVSFPFLANLGRVIYEREVQRNKEVFPDLSEFQLLAGALFRAECAQTEPRTVWEGWELLWLKKER